MPALGTSAACMGSAGCGWREPQCRQQAPAMARIGGFGVCFVVQSCPFYVLSMLDLHDVCHGFSEMDFRSLLLFLSEMGEAIWWLCVWATFSLKNL